MSPAKEYLLQLSNLEHQIRRLEWDIADTESRLGVRGLSYDRDKVQTSAADPMAAVFAELDKLERRETLLIAELKRRRTRIIVQIGRLREPLATLLELRYVKCLRLDKVAESMNYSYDHIRRLHGEALKEFEDENRTEVGSWLTTG